MKTDPRPDDPSVVILFFFLVSRFLQNGRDKGKKNKDTFKKDTMLALGGGSSQMD